MAVAQDESRMDDGRDASAISEQLRLVWNARGAIDIALIGLIATVITNLATVGGPCRARNPETREPTGSSLTAGKHSRWSNGQNETE